MYSLGDLKLDVPIFQVSDSGDFEAYAFLSRIFPAFNGNFAHLFPGFFPLWFHSVTRYLCEQMETKQLYSQHIKKNSQAQVRPICYKARQI